MASLPDFIKMEISGNHQMKRYLESLLKRVPSTKRSWVYDGEHGNLFMEPDDVRDAWVKKLAKLLENQDEVLEAVYQFDTSQLEKWGPQGGHAPIKELMDDVVLPTFAASAQHPTAFDDALWELAKQRKIRQYKQYGVARLRPASYERVVEDMRARDTLESNSGFPDFKRRNLPEVKQRAIDDARSGAWKTYPAIALFRTYNGKTRLVWMFPMSANLVEGSFFQVLFSAMLKTGLIENFFCPWKGFEAVRRLVTMIYDQGKEIGASDFTSTDAHFQWATTSEVYDVISQCFQPQYREALKESLEYMHNIPLLIGPNQMLTGAHGVSSGSNWTNFIETVFDDILSEYVALKTVNKVKGLYAIGDDMAWVASKFPEQFKEELEDFGKSVGQIIRADKTMIEPDKVKTLQRLFIRNYRREDNQLRGVYSTIRALKSSIYPERFHDPRKWSKDMFAARQFMILENCVDHPCFKEFVAFICRGNRYLPRFARKSAKELDAITREAKLIPGLNPTYNQEKRDQSLATFKSIRYASTL